MPKKDENKEIRQPRVKVSRAVLTDEGFERRTVRTQSADCIGCHDEPGAEYAEGHIPVTLVTKAEAEKASRGSFDVRCPACRDEHDNRKRNAKHILKLRESIRTIDEVLAEKSKLGLNSDQVKVLQNERSYCADEIGKAFSSPEEAAQFINQ